MSTTNAESDFARDYDREMFRSKLYSALWALIAEKKKDGFRLSDLAARLGKDKGYISRLFSQQENCKLNTVSDLVHALDANIQIEVVERPTKRRFGAGGMVRSALPINAIVRHRVDYEEQEEMDYRYAVRRG